MITAILALLSTRWVKYIIGSIAIVAGLWFGIISPYNNYVSTEKVAAALVKERATTTPAFNALTQQFKDIENNIIQTRKQAKSDADAALAKEQDRADKATAKYKDQVRLVKSMAVDRDAIYSQFNNLPDSMWDLEDISAAHDGSSAGIVSLSGYTRRLIKRYQSCERDLDTAIRTAAAAVDRAAVRGAAVEALKR